MTKKARVKITESGSNHSSPKSKKLTWDMPLVYKPFREGLRNLVVKGGDTVGR